MSCMHQVENAVQSWTVWPWLQCSETSRMCLPQCIVSAKQSVSMLEVMVPVNLVWLSRYVLCKLSLQ